jgi:hypothetical protein
MPHLTTARSSRTGQRLAPCPDMDVCQHRYMPLKRTSVYADAEDPALIKKIAARRGAPDAQLPDDL